MCGGEEGGVRDRVNVNFMPDIYMAWRCTRMYVCISIQIGTVWPKIFER